MPTPLESYKAELSFAKIDALIAHYQETGWENIAQHDVQALKYAGVFVRPKTPGFFMVRVRVPGGILKAGGFSAAQMRVLAEITDEFGRDVLDLTTRQQVQLRWIRADAVTSVLTRLKQAGMTTLQTGFDNVRNITTCPAAGLDASEVLDTRPLVEELNAAIIGNWSAANLPRKFNITVSGCRCDCTHGEINDIALMPAEKDGVVGFNVWVGGALGAWGTARAVSLDMFVRPDEAKDACLAIIAVYREKGDREKRGRSRLKFLLDAMGMDAFRSAVAARLPYAAHPAGSEWTEVGCHHDHIGVHPQKTDGLVYVGLHVPAGRLTLKQADGLARLAEEYGNGELRLTPAQNILLPNVPHAKLDALLAEPLLHELSPAPSPFLRGLTACAGNTFCAFARIDTKARALELVHYLDEALGQDALQEVGALDIHVSGCMNSCANPWVGSIGLIGKKIKRDDGMVEAADICLGGEPGMHGAFARLWRTDVPFTELGSFLEGLLRRFLQEKAENEGFRHWCFRSGILDNEA
ncbi:precorrin-3B synthase [Ethanoligenens sp.]|uniref:precorrin-3B synthase n=1 Tax=Ethanoligenens sp. TaxID=2099655 RepID=UPI0039E92B12